MAFDIRQQVQEDFKRGISLVERFGTLLKEYIAKEEKLKKMKNDSKKIIVAIDKFTYTSKTVPETAIILAEKLDKCTEDLNNINSDTKTLQEEMKAIETEIYDILRYLEHMKDMIILYGNYNCNDEKEKAAVEIIQGRYSKFELGEIIEFVKKKWKPILA